MDAILPAVFYALAVLLTPVIVVMIIRYSATRHAVIEAQQVAGEKPHGIALIPVPWAAVCVHITSLVLFLVSFLLIALLPSTVPAAAAAWYGRMALPGVIFAAAILFGQLATMLACTLRQS